MKKFSALFSAILLVFAVNTMAQNTVNLPDISLVPGPVSIPVEVDFSIHPVAAFEIQVNFDTSVLEYTGVTEISFTGISSSVAGSQPVLLTWYGTASSFNGDLIILNFNYTGSGGVTDLTFTETGSYFPGVPTPGGDPSWLADGGTPSTVVTTTFTGGSITYVSPVPLSIWTVLLGIVLIATFIVMRFYRIV